MRKPLIAVIAFILVLCIAPAALADGAELIDNGALDYAETGLPEGWMVNSWLTGEGDYDVSVAEGYRGGGVHIINYVENDVRFCQTVQVKKNSYYKLSCYIKTAGVYGGAGANISVADSLATSVALTGDNDWTYVELIGKTGRKQDTLTVCVRVGGYSALATGEGWFDDISVVKLEDVPSAAADFAPVESGSSSESGQYGVPYLGTMILVTLAFLAVFLVCRRRMREDGCIPDSDRSELSALILLLAAAFLARIVLALCVFGHPTDIYCFMSWGESLVQDGLSSFYTSGKFADYTPGYMYVLYATGWLSRAFGFGYGSMGCMMITKLPSIIADVLAAYIVFKLARRRYSFGMSMAFTAFCAFNPVMAFISGGWGQIDQILALLLLASAYLFIGDGERRRVILAGLVYGVAIAVKPQALMAGPLFAVAYALYVRDNGWKGLIKTLAAVASAVALIWISSLPFKGTQEPLWIALKYFNTATSYPYASIEAYNLFALLGGNWKNVNDTLFIFTYAQWGTVLMAISVAFSMLLYWRGRKQNPHCLTLCMAYQLCALFMLGQYMHERYMFPVLLLLLIAVIYYGDRRLYLCFGLLSAGLLLNTMGAFVIIDDSLARGAEYDALTACGSLFNLASFGYFTYVCCSIVFKRRIEGFMRAEAHEKPLPELPKAKDIKLHFNKRDRLYCIAITAVYAVIALVNLGTTQAPETAWYGYAGDTAEIRFESSVTIEDIRVFGGLYTGTVELVADDGTVAAYTEANDYMFRWHSIGGQGTVTGGFTLRVTEGSVWFNEIAFFDANGYVAAVSDAAELCDEPDQTPDTPSYLNGMYFDELYHARTAYEHLTGLAPYENSHPPLGKVFIMLGIAIFGMNAFGWRIIGTLFGIGMVPVMYAFAKRLFKRSDYALLASALFAFDFMHFTQTRIATIDVYGVFFILLMYYYMYQYYRLNFFSDGLKKTLRPLGLAGLFFGLGAASKWICIYAGLGLAVILFTSLIQRGMEYARLRNSEDEAVRNSVAEYPRYLIKTLLFCCVFYIALPVAIYIASYAPYFLANEPYDLAGVWGVQEFMFNYHSGLTATHPYQSSWWQWPLILRPVWYYVGYDVPEDCISTISAMGNPAVWWTALVGTIAMIAQLIRRKLKLTPAVFVLLVGIGANLLPWVLVTRCTFLYHYFATVPFIILCAVYMLMRCEKRTGRGKYIKWIWMGAAIALFILFYPVISGLTCPRWYVTMLEWLPGWTFMGI